MGSGEVYHDWLDGGKHESSQVSFSLQSVTGWGACCCHVTSDLCVFRCICFSQDGSCLYSGATDSLRVFGWEPDRCFDVVPVGWGKVSDLAVCNQQLVCSATYRRKPFLYKRSLHEASKQHLKPLLLLLLHRSVCLTSSPVFRPTWWI